MPEPRPDPRVQLSRLEFRIRNLEGKRRGLRARLGRALLERFPADPPVAWLARDFRAARARLDEVARLEQEDTALAAELAGVSRGARLMQSLARGAEKGQDYLRSMQAESRLQGLLAERAGLLARLGRGLSARREDLRDEWIDRRLAQADLLEAEAAALEAEARELREASAALDPRMRLRLIWIAAGLALAILALCWWVVLRMWF